MPGIASLQRRRVVQSTRHHTYHWIAGHGLGYCNIYLIYDIFRIVELHAGIYIESCVCLFFSRECCMFTKWSNCQTVFFFMFLMSKQQVPYFVHLGLP